MKLGIVGTRSYNDYAKFKTVIFSLINIAKVTSIVSGGAKGVDTFAEELADESEITKNIIYPDWDTHGKSAGFKRNILIIDDSDLVIAFWNGVSKGTKHSINIAIEKNKPLIIVNYETWDIEKHNTTLIDNIMENYHESTN